MAPCLQKTTIELPFSSKTKRYVKTKTLSSKNECYVRLFNYGILKTLIVTECNQSFLPLKKNLESG